jgi:hypothetical protein
MSAAKPRQKYTDVGIAAGLVTLTKVWLGYVGLAAALESRNVSLNGRATFAARRLLALSSQPRYWPILANVCWGNERRLSSR